MKGITQIDDNIDGNCNMMQNRKEQVQQDQQDIICHVQITK
jgi:hypothetical protein